MRTFTNLKTVFDEIFTQRMIVRRVTLRLWFCFIFISIFLLISLMYKSPAFTDCQNFCPFSSRITNKNIRFNSSFQIHHYPEFVCPQNFRNLADWIYRWPSQFQERIVTKTDNGKLIAPCLPHGSIIYVRIWAIEEFFQNIYPHLINQFVLITGEGDLSSPVHLEYLEDSESKIIHWFGQNGQFDVSKSKKFTHIPIGINCYEMARAIRKIHLQHSDHKLPTVFDDIDEPKHYIQPMDITHRKFNQSLVLINFDPGTDGTGLRSKIWNDLCTNNNYSFVTCFKKPSGVQIDRMSNIYERNLQYPFWLSPRGNGLDCHRTWEALYLNRIPIVWNNSLTSLYKNLPVLIINNHYELNISYLKEKFRQITEKKSYQYEKLRHAYWRRLILEKSRYQKKVFRTQRDHQCWQATNNY